MVDGGESFVCCVEVVGKSGSRVSKENLVAEQCSFFVSRTDRGRHWETAESVSDNIRFAWGMLRVKGVSL